MKEQLVEKAFAVAQEIHDEALYIVGDALFWIIEQRRNIRKLLP